MRTLNQGRNQSQGRHEPLGHNKPLALLFVGCALVLLLAGCGPAPPPAATPQAGDQAEEPENPSTAFLGHLRGLCGQAFPGALGLEPPGDDMLTGTELLLAHFRECSDEELRIPFHIEVEEDESWDRSRTWLITWSGDQLELRHDHRDPDGRPSERTQYGGFTETPGTPNRQDFVSVERTEESGYPRGWRLEIMPGERFSYGTTRRGEWSWRVDFDLSRSVPAPPPPWGS